MYSSSRIYLPRQGTESPGQGKGTDVKIILRPDRAKWTRKLGGEMGLSRYQRDSEK